MPTQLQMLGAPRVFIDGRTVAIPWQRRTLDLLTYLFTSRGSEPRDAVAFGLWPDDEEETARAHLRRNLNVLRSLLPPAVAAWIVADAGTVVSAHAAADTDVAACGAALDAGDLTAAVGLYAGDFGGASAEPHALTELVGIEFSTRRFDAALAHARRIFADQPFRELLVHIGYAHALGSRYRHDRGRCRQLPLFAWSKNMKKLASLIAILAVGVAPAMANPGDQKIIKEVTAAKGWSVVPLDLNGDCLYRSAFVQLSSGRAIDTVADTSVAGTQHIVNDYVAARDWSSIVPLNVNNDYLTDLLSYNGARASPSTRSVFHNGARRPRCYVQRVSRLGGVHRGLRKYLE